MRLTAFAAGLLAALGNPGPPAAGQQDETLYLEEVKPKFFEQLQQLEERKDWKGFFEWAEEGRRRYGRHLVRADKQSWASLSEHLLRRFARLPAEAHEAYRLEYDGRARVEFDRARERGDRRLLEDAVEEFFLSSPAAEALDFLGSLRFEEGAPEEAVFHWNRLLRFHPAGRSAAAVIAARIAHACASAGDGPGLEGLRRYVEAEGLDGPVVVAGRPRRLREYLAEVAEAAPGPPAAAADPGPPGEGATAEVRNEVRRWTFEFEQERPPAQVQRIVMAGVPGPPPDHFPFLPAYARVRGREYVILTDGKSVVAVDPARVRSSSPEAGIYWRFAPRLPARPPSARSIPFQGVFAAPYVGATVDGDRAYVAMHSENVPREAQDAFDGPASVKCLHVPTGKLLWDTDSPALFEEFRRLSSVSGSGFDFLGKNFFFTSPVLVRSGRIYVGVSTSPSGEQESRVLCLDRETGRPLWCTFLSSVLSGGGHPMARMGPGGDSQTLLAERGGVVYAHANQGVVAALNGVDGGVLWLSRYPRSVPSRSFPVYEGGGSPRRPAGWPLLWKGYVLVLPQDRVDLVVFDRFTGRLLDLPPPKLLGGEFRWRDIRRLVGIRGDDLIAGGSPQSYRILLNEFLRPGDGPGREAPRFSANGLVASDVRVGGFGAFHGNLLYLSVAGYSSSTGALAIYDTNTWKTLVIHPWRDASDGGNLLVAGRSLVAAGRRVSIYADARTIRQEYGPRIDVSPPRLEALLEFGDLMRENGRLEEAAEAYGRFLDLAEGDPGSAERGAQVRAELHGIFLRRGEEAARQDPARALREYGKARTFAPNPGAEAEAVLRMAEECEELGRWKEAADLCQELIEKAGNQVRPGKEGEFIRLWEWGRRRIGAIASRAPEAVAEIERRAAAALGAAGEGAEALRAVMDRFPGSRAAREAWRRLVGTLRRAGRLEPLRALYGEFRDRFGEDLDFESSRDMLDALERLGDRARWRHEMVRFGERFGGRPAGPGAAETVRAYVERRLGEASPPAARPGAGPLRVLGEVGLSREGGGGGVYGPLRPAGVEPPGFGIHLELFSTGRDVELWDLRGKPERLWSFRPAGAEPGGAEAPLVGAAYTRDYALAAAWEDGVASVDLGTGRARWRFRGLRDGHKISGVHATDGRLFLGETRPEGNPGRNSWRLLCLDDSTGGLAWARDLEVEDPASIRFLGPYLAEQVAMLHRGPSGWLVLVLSSRDGAVIRRETLAPQVLTHAEDAGGEVLYAVVFHGDPSQKVLRSLLVGPSGRGRRPLDVPLRRHLQPGHQACRLAMGGEWVGLVASPTPQAPEPRILIFRSSDGGLHRSIPLPEGRTLPPVPLAAMDDEGILYVYNVRRGEAGAAAPPRAYLTAFRAGTGEGEDATAWDAPAPAAETAEASWIVPVPPRHLLLALARGRPPGAVEGSPLAAIYDKAAGGYLRGVHGDLAVTVRPGGREASCPAAWWRGRLHLGTVKGIRILGP